MEYVIDYHITWTAPFKDEEDAQSYWLALLEAAATMGVEIAGAGPVPKSQWDEAQAILAAVFDDDDDDGTV